MAERGLFVDHTTIWRWTQTYGPEVYRRLQGEGKRKSSTWHMDETFVRIAGKWLYLFRAVDSHGQTVDFHLSETRNREAAKLFLKRALASADNRPPNVLARDGLRSYPAAVRELQAEGRVSQHCRQRTRRYSNNRIESDHRHVEASVTSNARPTDQGHRLGRDSGDRSGADDSQGAGFRNHSGQPTRASLGFRCSLGRRIAST
jgi:transposase-like protein